jgi:outer membrane protein OmpA-like peptidoglycan-associated protein
MKVISLRAFSVLLILSYVACGCDRFSWTSRETGALAGTALGAGLGAVVGNQVGNSGAGVAIGSAFGALSGALVGESVRQNQEALVVTESRLRDQEHQIAENKRLLDELRSKGTDVHETHRGVVINLPDVLFDFNSAQIRPEARPNIAEIAQILQSSPGRHISVEGHTDSLGTIEVNEKLSLLRAKNVASALTKKGVSAGRISARGFGESRPLISNSSPEGRQRNRRVEVIVENSEIHN